MKLYAYIILCLIINNSANAIVINNYKFVEYGGDINNSNNTYKTPYNKLYNVSLFGDFLSTGTISTSNSSWCTGIWLGNTANGDYIRILTAAHCIKYDKQNGKTELGFRDYRGWLAGQGGYYYILPKRMNMNSQEDDLSSDIAILSLKKVRTILGPDGKPISQPILNDAEDEGNKPVEFVGHGYWGTHKNGTQIGWKALNGSRRAWGKSVVKANNSSGYVIAGFSGESGADWARSAVGDGGMPWFQNDPNSNGKYVVAVNVGYGSEGSYGTRVAPHKEWIRSIVPTSKWRTNSGRCYWLNYKNGRWVWEEYNRLTDQKECLQANQCHKGGGCYKWDVAP